MDPNSPIYNDSFLLNFTLNPKWLLMVHFAGAQQITRDNYEISNHFQQQLQLSCITIPDSPTVLNQNYSINSYQIIDMVTNYYTQQQINSMFGMLSNYLLVSPTTQIQLNNNYTITSTQISNLNNVLDNYVLQLNFLQTLNNYMQINPKNNTAINSYYTINSSQITDLSNTFSNYLLSSPQSTTALNTNYTLTCAQVTDIANNYCSLNYVDQQLANYVSITYFSQNLAFYPTISYANSNYMIISPTNSTAINNNYTMASTQITDFNSATANIPSQTINTSQIQNNTIQISNLDSSLAPIFYSLYSCSQQEAISTNQGQTKSYQSNTPLGFYHYNKSYYNGTLMSNNQIYIGGSYYQFKTTNSMVLTSSSSYINFDTTKQIYGADKGSQGAIGMFSALGPFNTFIGSTALGVNLTVIIQDQNKKKIKLIHFGDRRYEDYTIHNNDQRKENYIKRHMKNENFNDILSKGFWALNILWNKKNIKQSKSDIEKRMEFLNIINKYQSNKDFIEQNATRLADYTADRSQPTGIPYDIIFDKVKKVLPFLSNLFMELIEDKFPTGTSVQVSEYQQLQERLDQAQLLGQIKKEKGSPYFFYSKFNVLDEIDTFSRILEKDLMKYLEFMMQVQYNISDQTLMQLNKIYNIANFNTDMQDQEIIYDTGRTYQESFEIALMKTKSLKDEIDSLINDEFPVETFQDKQTKNIKPRLKK
ncbi:hypothetical protein ABPG72_001146 [Tetrahymena utriculariae]